MTAKLAIWWLIASEIVIFGGLLACYIMHRLAHHEWGLLRRAHQRVGGSDQHAHLLTSSLFAVLAHHAAEQGDGKKAARNLLITCCFGLGFLVVKSLEWSTEIAHGYTITANTFWSFYYTAAGIHGAHVIIGMLCMLWVANTARQGKELHRVENVGCTGTSWTWCGSSSSPFSTSRSRSTCRNKQKRPIQHDSHGHDDHEHHDVSFYYKTYAALVVLFLVSVIGPYIGEVTGIQVITLITAFGIAVVKAGIVIRNFMHLNVEKAFVHYFLITSLAFMFLFFFAVAPDVMKHEGTRWENVAAKSWIEKVDAEYAAGGGDHHGGGHDAGGHDEGGHAPEGEHKEEGGHH